MFIPSLKAANLLDSESQDDKSCTLTRTSKAILSIYILSGIYVQIINPCHKRRQRTIVNTLLIVSLPLYMHQINDMMAS